MASSMNRVFLMGNVTRDPELRYISNGSAVTEIGLAINDRRKSLQASGLKKQHLLTLRYGAVLPKSQANT